MNMRKFSNDRLFKYKFRRGMIFQSVLSCFQMTSQSLPWRESRSRPVLCAVPRWMRARFPFPSPSSCNPMTLISTHDSLFATIFGRVHDRLFKLHEGLTTNYIILLSCSHDYCNVYPVIYTFEYIIYKIVSTCCDEYLLLST